MDFHGMKRKRLQALCKKHGIPANLKSCVMADRLSLLFKEKEMEYPVGSGNARTEKDTTLHCVVCKNVEMIDLVTPSPGSKERSVFTSKNLKGSEIERLEFETNFSPEITREDFGICGVGNMQSRLKKEHDNSQGGLHLAPVAVALVEFNNQMSEGEDEKLGDNNNLIGDICEYEKGKTEAEEHGIHNSLRGSNMKDVNALHSSKEEYGSPMKVEDEATEQGDCNSPQGSRMKDVKVLYVSHEESGYPVVEKDEAVEQGDKSSSPGSNMKDVNALHVSVEESGSPMMEEGAAIDQGNCISSQGSSMKNVNIFHVSQEESGYPVVEKDEAEEQGDHNSPPGSNTKDVTVLHASEEECGFLTMVEEDNALKQGPSMKDVNILLLSQKVSDYPIAEDVAVEQGDNNSPQGPNIKDVNILHVYQEESLYPVVEEDVAVEQGDQNISQGPNMKEVNVLHVCLEESGYPMVEEEEVVEQGDHNSPQGSNLKDVSVMHVSQEDFGFPTVEEVQKAEGNICNGSVYDLLNTGSEVDAKNTDGKINLTAEHSVDDGPSSLSKSSVGTHDQFQSSYPENEVVSSGLNIYQDTCKEELKSPQNTGPIANPGECSRFSPHNLEASLVESFQFETYSDPSPLGDIGTCNLKESMQSYKIEKVEYKTKATIEQFTDELQSSTFEDSDGTPVQFVSNDALSEVKTDFNVHEMVVSGIVFENVDMSEAKFVSSRKISLRPASDRMIDFSPKQLNNSETKVLQSETKLFPETADVGIGEMENMQMDVNKELVDEVGDYLLEGEIDKSGLIADSEEVDNVICDVEENMQIIVNEKQDEESEQVIRATPSPMLLNNVEVGEQLLEGEIEKSGLKADSEECIGILPNNLLPSATKGFEDEIYFDQSALGDVVETFKMEESMPSDQMEKGFSQKVQHMANDSVQEEITRLIINSDDHEYVGVTGPEDGKNQHNMKRDMESIEKYLLNDFHTLEDENAPTMPGEGEMKLCSFNHQQMSASGTFCGDEMETPPKCTSSKLRESFIKKELKNLSSLPVKRARDILGASDMKENIKISKKTPSRSAFPKRKPLQHLQQN
ncbi:uncharacterized protein LOC106775522 isoform X2 [Vigna radiata var. radiata]|uniref:Uncharacterized protein LOC106775522 isoform X2 n=1 Tax=Vigna radiata var. radiata TaxID=3916 RepID=A0A3Q0FE81_VIGRR|nr:uncharacterized protein LOC106775522 isoform X2 [Vigna radiata var. radiata]